MTAAVVVLLALFVLVTTSAYGTNEVIQKVNDHFEIVGVGNAIVHLEEGLIGFHVKQEQKCSFVLRFQGEQDSETVLSVNIGGNYLGGNTVTFGTSGSVDIFLASNGTLFKNDKALPTLLKPLNPKSGDDVVNMEVSNIADSCKITVVKGAVTEEIRNENSSGGLPAWAIALIVIFVLVLLIGTILLVIFYRRLPCFKRKLVTGAEEKDLVEVKVDSKVPQKKPVPELISKPPKASKRPSSSQPPPSLPPTPSVSAPPTATETTPTPPPPAAPTEAAPPLPLPPPSVEPLAPRSVVSPPPPSVAPPTSTVTAPRFTAKGSRVHPSVPQHLVDNPTPTKSRSSERKRRNLRKNSLEEGNRPPGYRPALPPPPPPPKVPSPPTEKQGPSAETEDGKKRCCPEKDATAPSATTTPAPAFRPTKKLSAKEYLNFTLSEGSTHGTNEGTEEGGRKSARGRASSEDKKSKSRETKKSRSVDGKPTAKKPPRQEDGQKRH